MKAHSKIDLWAITNAPFWSFHTLRRDVHSRKSISVCRQYTPFSSVWILIILDWTFLVIIVLHVLLYITYTGCICLRFNVIPPLNTRKLLVTINETLRWFIKRNNDEYCLHKDTLSLLSNAHAYFLCRLSKRAHKFNPLVGILNPASTKRRSPDRSPWQTGIPSAALQRIALCVFCLLHHNWLPGCKVRQPAKLTRELESGKISILI